MSNARSFFSLSNLKKNLNSGRLKSVTVFFLCVFLLPLYFILTVGASQTFSCTLFFFVLNKLAKRVRLPKLLPLNLDNL